jgi:serine/threonine-protein kinase
MDQSGRVILGKYELVAYAAEGGMATVWRGVTRGAEGFSRPVAIKRILRQLRQNDQFVSMFIEEARVGSQLQHPNIVQIEDFGQDEGGDYFMISEWIEGIDLGRYVLSYQTLGQPTPWPLVVAIALEILRGLSWAHGHTDSEGQPAPIFHRDITPGNILISVNGTAKLSDFGLARSMDRGRMTDPNIIKGKLAYLAPEMTFGEAPSVQTDLYSLGIVLWEALAGRKLFQGDTDIEVFLGVRKGEIPPLSGERTDIPVELGLAVQRALAFERARRYDSAHAMSRALANILRSVPIATDARAISQSVIEAQQRLGIRPVPPPVR